MEIKVGARSVVRVGDFCRLSKGPTWKGERIFSLRGLYRVRQIQKRRGQLFVDVVKVEAGLCGALYTVRVSGGSRPSRSLPNVMDRAYKIRRASR